MDRRGVLLGSVGVCAAVAAVGLSEIAEAQDGKQAVQKVIDAFDAALSSLDVNKMMALWSQGPDLVLLNPRDKEAAIGTDAVKKSWEEPFSFWESLKVSVKGTSTIHVGQNTAYRYSTEAIEGKTKAGKALAFTALATTTFEKRGNEWLITSHHASSMPS
jgi:ketosteroid isomerase-like protein